ncbi:MAG: agmatinase [Planctomycetes bacterium]|nr:agmatinase [Planctomycetota bacterium]
MEEKTQNFLGLEVHPKFEEADVVVLPIGYEQTTTYQQGTARGPNAIIKASAQVEMFDDELVYDATEHLKIHTMLDPHIEAPPEVSANIIEREITRILGAGKFPVMLGGEHSISLGAIRAIAKKHERFSILHIDAHADMRDSYEGTSFGHGCVMRRVAEMFRTTNPGGELVQVGIRSLCRDEYDFVQSCDFVHFYPMHRIRAENTPPEEIVEKLHEKVYFTIDVDGFDPSVIPGTGTPEPGGIMYPFFLKLARVLAERRKVVGLDLVEVMPVSGNTVSEFTAARMLYKILCYLSKFQAIAK